MTKTQKQICQSLVFKKAHKLMKEGKDRSQSFAVAFQIIRKKHPECRKFIKKKD